METLKQEIKKLVQEQIVLKDQKKTVYNKLERTIDPTKARYLQLSNKEDLRIMYAALGVLRGKTFSQVENKYPEESHPLNMYKKAIDKLVELHIDEKVIRFSEQEA